LWKMSMLWPTSWSALIGWYISRALNCFTADAMSFGATSAPALATDRRLRQPGVTGITIAKSCDAFDGKAAGNG